MSKQQLARWGVTVCILGLGARSAWYSCTSDSLAGALAGLVFYILAVLLALAWLVITE